VGDPRVVTEEVISDAGISACCRLLCPEPPPMPLTEAAIAPTAALTDGEVMDSFG